MELKQTRWSAIVALSLGIILMALDMTIVTVTLPIIGAEMNAPPGATQWVMLAYLLPMVSLAIPAGRWLDGAGLRRTFMVAIGGFSLSSLFIALAPGFGFLLAGRALQGVFASLISVLSFPITVSSVRPEHRGRAMGLIATLVPLAGVAGPGLGGLLADVYGWRSVFFINIPVAIVAMWMGWRSVPRGSGRLTRPNARMLGEVALLGAAVTALFLALDGGGSPVLVGMLLAFGVAAAAIWVRLPQSRPVIRLLSVRPYALPVSALIAMTTASGMIMFLLPYLFAAVLHQPARVTGLALLVMSAAMAGTSPVAGSLADRYGARRIALVGGLVSLIGMIALTTVGSGAGVIDVAWRVALLGIGSGLFVGPVNTSILNATPAEMTGTSGGVTSLFRTFGFSLGPAAGALAWSITGGGLGGFQLGAIVAAVMVLLAWSAIAAARRRRPAVPAPAIAAETATDLQPVAA